MRFDLIDLKLLLAIAEAGSITRGAELSHMALASASARIKALEDSLGAPLFERQRHGVQPTAAGRAAIHHAQAVMHQLQMMNHELGNFASGLRGRVRLLSNTAALAEHLPEVLGDYLLQHPQIDLDIEERPSHAIVDALHKRQAELGVLADSTDMIGLEARPLCSDPLLLISSRDQDAVSAQHRVRFDELLERAFVGLAADNPLQAHITGKALKAGRPLSVRLRVSSFEAMCGLVARGVGVAILPQAALQRSAFQTQLRAWPLQDAWATRTLYLCAPSFAQLTPQAATLAEHILAASRPNAD
ncbi:LysR family transcriptional regulator [Pseudomonas sp. PDM14]|uniref:LysR family transcriptional regulator n=1 Tax=Pseudomonas sp. PDM14 TaxID=2769288 RepID=UPI00177F5D59|nr:LysR family transcriptional regulator [Pseudomonas sp. PDM14]MBD9481531.1 LysR family transcriptional regulator [Pseudomonas sp. PDM14]